MTPLVALWRREFRAHRLPLLGLVVIAAAIDALLIAQSRAVGDVSPFDRPMDQLLPFVVVVAAVLANRVFGGEEQRGTWPWLFSLPLAPSTVMLAKLWFVVGGTVALVWWRLAVHGVFGAPSPWPELVVRVAARGTAVAMLAAAILSAFALLGRRAALLGLVALVGVDQITDLLGVSLTSDGPLGLVEASDAGVNDRVWPTADLIVTGLLSLAAGGVVVAAGRAQALTAWMARPWSRRASVVLAALLGALVTVDVGPIDREIDAVPTSLALEPGRPFLVPTATTTSRGVASSPTGNLDHSRAAAERALALMARAVPDATLPRVIMVQRDDVDGATTDVIDAHTVQVAAAATSTPAVVVQALVAGLLRQHHGSEAAPVGFVVEGLPRAIGHHVAPAEVPRVVVARRATCDDVRDWPQFSRTFGAEAAASALLFDVVAAHGEPALLAMVAAVWRGEDDVIAVLEASAPVCARPPPTTAAPWLAVGPLLGATVELRRVSHLTAAPFIQLHATPFDMPATAEVTVWEHGVVDDGRVAELVSEPVPLEALLEGTLVGVTVAPGTPLSVQVVVHSTGGREHLTRSTGKHRAEAP